MGLQPNDIIAADIDGDTCVPLGDPRSSVALALPGFDKMACADKCLAPLILALNEAGFRTMASCCGHGRQTASILFSMDDVKVKVARPVEGKAREWVEITAPDKDFLIEIPGTVLRKCISCRAKTV